MIVEEDDDEDDSIMDDNNNNEMKHESDDDDDVDADNGNTNKNGNGNGNENKYENTIQKQQSYGRLKTLSNASAGSSSVTYNYEDSKYLDDDEEEYDELYG
eukprot:10339_1